MGRKAEEINSLHQKMLLGEKRKTEEATVKVIYLLKTVQDLNRRLMVSTRSMTPAAEEKGVTLCPHALLSPQIEEMIQRNMKIYAKAKAEKGNVHFLVHSALLHISFIFLGGSSPQMVTILYRLVHRGHCGGHKDLEDSGQNEKNSGESPSSTVTTLDSPSKCSYIFTVTEELL